MPAIRIRALVCAFAMLLVAPGAIAQPAAGGAPAAKPDPGLSALAASRAADLNAAGVQKIVARTGKNKRDIQVLTTWGPAYFGWPKGASPAPFELVVKGNNAVAVSASGYTDAKRAQYASALDAIVPEAVRVASELRAKATRPKP